MSPDACEILARLTAILERVAYQARACRLCGARVYWIKTRLGENVCLNADGTRHKVTCAHAPPSRARAAAQEALFPHEARAQAFDPQ